MHLLRLILGSLLSLDSGVMPTRVNDISNCLKEYGVPFAMPGSLDWNNHTTGFNARIPTYNPSGIAVPTTISQVQGAVNCGRKHGVSVSAKGGGHSYISGGLGGESGHLVVQLDRMHNVDFNDTTNIAVVQPGTRLGHLATELYTDGRKRAISHGTCPRHVNYVHSF